VQLLGWVGCGLAWSAGDVPSPRQLGQHPLLDPSPHSRSPPSHTPPGEEGSESPTPGKGHRSRSARHDLGADPTQPGAHAPAAAAAHAHTSLPRRSSSSNSSRPTQAAEEAAAAGAAAGATSAAGTGRGALPEGPGLQRNSKERMQQQQQQQNLAWPDACHGGSAASRAGGGDSGVVGEGASGMGGGRGGSGSSDSDSQEDVGRAVARLLRRHYPALAPVLLQVRWVGSCSAAVLMLVMRLGGEGAAALLQGHHPALLPLLQRPQCFSLEQRLLGCGACGLDACTAAPRPSSAA